MTKIERLSPELKALADKLGYKIHYRGKAYWAGSEIQLTYEMYPSGPINNLKDKIPYAISILKKIEKQRDKGRDIPTRLKELIALFKKTEQFPRGYFTYLKTHEDDKLTILNQWGLTAWLKLIGEPDIELKDFNNKEDLLIALENTLDSFTSGKDKIKCEHSQ